MQYARENLLVWWRQQHVVSYQTGQVCSLLFAEETGCIFILTDTSMKDCVTFEIVSRRKEAAIIPGITITFTIIDGLQILLEINASELT